jgi:hypothetical protein
MFTWLKISKKFLHEKQLLAEWDYMLYTIYALGDSHIKAAIRADVQVQFLSILSSRVIYWSTTITVTNAKGRRPRHTSFSVVLAAAASAVKSDSYSADRTAAGRAE